jgi:hypothetical protein
MAFQFLVVSSVNKQFRAPFFGFEGHQSHFRPLKVYYFIIHIRFLIDYRSHDFFVFQMPFLGSDP